MIKSCGGVLIIHLRYTIMAVLAVLLIHMESRAVGSMKPRSTCIHNFERAVMVTIH